MFISCLECEFVGPWTSDPTMFYQADLNVLGAIVKLVELNGTKKTIQFKRGAYVTLLPNNVLTYEREDEEESVYIDEDEKSGKRKNQTVLDD